MRLVKSSFEILNQEPGLKGIYKQIELAGRTCYKSLDKITNDSAEGFVNRMIASKHYAMLEHGAVYLRIPDKWYEDTWVYPARGNYSTNKYSFTKKAIEGSPMKEHTVTYVTTNYRILVENGWLDDLRYLCEPTEYHEKRVTVRFTTDRGVSHEFVRHRVFSFAQESTRYCNYSKDKFGNELTFIIPSDSELSERGYEQSDYIFDNLENKDMFSRKEDACFAMFLSCAEEQYLDLIHRWNWLPQRARQVLPNALKTELVMTGFISDWQHFFDLRARGTTGAPHPDAKALAEPLMNEFIQRKYIDEKV